METVNNMDAMGWLAEITNNMDAMGWLAEIKKNCIEQSSYELLASIIHNLFNLFSRQTH
jgi:hypothetical protein